MTLNAVINKGFDPLTYSPQRLLRWRQRFAGESALLLRTGGSRKQIEGNNKRLVLLDAVAEMAIDLAPKVELLLFSSLAARRRFADSEQHFSGVVKIILAKQVDAAYPQTPWCYYFHPAVLTGLAENLKSPDISWRLLYWMGFCKIEETTRMVFYPAFGANDDIQFFLTRISWYLGCIPNRQIQVFADHLPESLKAEKFYDPACIEIYTQMLESNTISCKAPALLDNDALTMADIIISWKPGSSERADLGVPDYQKWLKKGKNIYNVDPRQRMESSKFINVSMDRVSLQRAVIAENKLKFDHFCQRIGVVDNAYLFATGPSSEAYTNYNYLSDSSLRVICNSVITDDAMLTATRPQILVFADPIFHFGCSSYARAFRQRLLEVSARYDFTIMIPIKHYALFCYHMPELVERTIGLPFNSSGSINPDLRKDFYIRSFDNILTFMMLPLGSTFAKNLYLIGCDGRPLDEDDYFWVHNKKVQFNAEMETIKKAHPAFFKTDYNEYYLRHCDSVLSWANVLEKNNIELKSLWGSFIPTLTERPGVPPFIQFKKINIFLDPAVSELSLREWAVDTEALNIVLCQHGLKINPQNLFCIPFFTASINEISESDQRHYYTELESPLARILTSLSQDWPAEAKLNFIFSEPVDSLRQLVKTACQMVLRPPRNLVQYSAKFTEHKLKGISQASSDL